MTARSVQNWMAAFRRAEAESGCGYLGLLDRVAERGNRNTRIPDASKQLLSEYLGTSREIVTFQMNHLRHEGFLRYSRKSIEIYADALAEHLRKQPR